MPNNTIIKPKWRRGVEVNVETTDVVDGNMLVTTDSGKLFIDIDGIRIQITDFVVSSKDIILGLANPLPKFYFAEDSVEFYFHTPTGWKRIGGTPKVNGKDVGKDDSIYAPTKSGSTGQILISDGVNKPPIWINSPNLIARLGFGYSVCNTEANTDFKIVALSDYNLVTGGQLTIKFTNAVNSGATLNVNGKGAKAIYHIGAPIRSNVIQEGDIALLVYDGTYYQLISVSSDAGGDYIDEDE